MSIVWSPDLDTGIPVIDQQHRRIVDFINDLEAAQVLGNQEQIKQVIYDCIDYTLSHFAFEESMQEEAGYQYCKPHKKVHELFTRKVAEYQQRMELGDDIAEELHGMLARWLVNHIKRDDADYVSAVLAKTAATAPVAPVVEEKKESGGWLRKLFGK